MSTQPAHMSHRGTNGTHTVRDTDADIEHAMPTDQPEPDADPALDVSDWFFERFPHSHSPADQVPHAQQRTAQPLAHAHSTADRGSALGTTEPQPHADAHAPADRSPTELSPERLRELYESLRSTTLGVCDVLDSFNRALKELADTFDKLARVLDERPGLPDLHDDAGGRGGDAGQSPGWNWKSSGP